MAKGNGDIFPVLNDLCDRSGHGFCLKTGFVFISALMIILPQLPFFPHLLEGRLTPDAPVLDFKLPMFGQNGYKIWELHGREGRYINEERIDVVDLSLRLYSGDEELQVHTTIESPSATMLVQQSRAEGKSKIKITGNQFQIDGENWQWEGKTRTVKVNKNVQVSFQQRLAGILK